MRFIKTFITVCCLIYVPTLLSLVQSPLDDIGTLPWVQKKIETYPELSWLMDEKVAMTQEGASHSSPTSWSFQLKQVHYPEFERTLLTLASFELIMNGTQAAYDRFVAPQPVHDKLSWTSFQKLHDFAVQTIGGSQERFNALEYNLVLGDMGKTEVVREKVPDITIADHDQFLDAVLEKDPSIFPSFSKQLKSTQDLLRRINGLVHFGHVTHAEGSPNMLKRLKESKIMVDHPKDFDLEILTCLCDVSGARGHETNQGSKVMSENTFRAILAVKEALHLLKDHTTTEALTHYLNQRGEWLGVLKGKDSFLLARLGAMTRLFTPAEGVALQKGFDALSEADKTLVREQWDPLTIRDEQTPTYIPAVLVNYMASCKKAGQSHEDTIENCLKKVVPMMARILQDFRQGKTALSYTSKNTLEFNKAAAQIRDTPVLADQGVNVSFTVDPKTGQVTING